MVRRTSNTVLRRHVTIPDDHVVVCGVALGYADDSHRLSTHRTTRQPVESFATFYESQDATEIWPMSRSGCSRAP